MPLGPCAGPLRRTRNLSRHHDVDTRFRVAPPGATRSLVHKCSQGFPDCGGRVSPEPRVPSNRRSVRPSAEHSAWLIGVRGKGEIRRGPFHLIRERGPTLLPRNRPSGRTEICRPPYGFRSAAESQVSPPFLDLKGPFWMRLGSTFGICARLSRQLTSCACWPDRAAPGFEGTFSASSSHSVSSFSCPGRTRSGDVCESLRHACSF